MTISIRYRGELRCEAVHRASSTTLLTDAPSDAGGEGAAFAATDLVATALATCMMTAMGAEARAQGVDIAGAKARVDKIMGGSPRRIGAISVHVDVPKRIARPVQARLERAALACPVKSSLRPDIAVTLGFSWA